MSADALRWIEGELLKGTRPSQISGLLDAATSSLVGRLKREAADKRHVTAQRDVLLEQAVTAADHFRPLAEFDGASGDVLAKLDKAIEDAR